MESANKGEARRCLEKAKQAFNRGEIKVAERLVSKSLRLCSSEEAKGK